MCLSPAVLGGLNLLFFWQLQCFTTRNLNELCADLDRNGTCETWGMANNIVESVNISIVVTKHIILNAKRPLREQAVSLGYVIEDGKRAL